MGRKRKFENRYEVIVQTAAKVFAHQGFEATTMDEIAKACDLGKATLYTEFKSKEDLMHGVIVWHQRNSLASVKQKAELAQAPYLPAIKIILQERIMGIYDRTTRHFYNADVLRAARKEVRDKSQLKDLREEETRIMANLLEKAALNKEIVPHSNYLQLYKLLRKALTGLFPPHIFDISRDDFERDAQEIIRIYLAGLTVSK